MNEDIKRYEVVYYSDTGKCEPLENPNGKYYKCEDVEKYLPQQTQQEQPKKISRHSGQPRSCRGNIGKEQHTDKGDEEKCAVCGSIKITTALVGDVECIECLDCESVYSKDQHPKEQPQEINGKYLKELMRKETGVNYKTAFTEDFAYYYSSWLEQKLIKSLNTGRE
jgi:hypothetical protein